VRPGVRVWSLARLSRCFEVVREVRVSVSCVRLPRCIFTGSGSRALGCCVEQQEHGYRSTVTTACQGGLLCKKQGKKARLQAECRPRLRPRDAIAAPVLAPCSFQLGALGVRSLRALC